MNNDPTSSLRKLVSKVRNSHARWHSASGIRKALAALTLGGLTLATGWVGAESNRVVFPANLEQLVHYSTVKRGESTEHMLTSPAALEAIQKGLPVPNGTHFVLVDYRDSKVFRYFVMQKGANWGADYDASRRTGDWQFQSFKPDKTINMAENTARCQSCHQSRDDGEYLYTFGDAKRFRLGLVNRD